MGKIKLNETYLVEMSIKIQLFSYIYWYQNSGFRVSVTIEPGRSLLTVCYLELFKQW